jgi:hypothetical protein
MAKLTKKDQERIRRERNVYRSTANAQRERRRPKVAEPPAAVQKAAAAAGKKAGADTKGKIKATTAKTE